jgi:hypothetical protein
MNLVDEREIEYPRTARVARPSGTYDAAGLYTESETTVIESLTVDIQLSLRVRRLISENGTGTTDSAAWIMFCAPPVPILAGDRVYDDIGRMFTVEAAGDWGSHTECVMKRNEEKEE